MFRLLGMNLHVHVYVCVCNEIISDLWLSFLLCNYVLYRRMFWQSIEDFYYLCENADF